MSHMCDSVLGVSDNFWSSELHICLVLYLPYRILWCSVWTFGLARSVITIAPICICVCVCGLVFVHVYVDSYLYLCMWACICICVCGLVFVFVYVDTYCHLALPAPLSVSPPTPPPPFSHLRHIPPNTNNEETLVFPDETAEYQWQAMVTPFCFFLFSGTKAQAVWMVSISNWVSGFQRE